MKRNTWTTGCEAADQAGFVILHCGHPTALWPYYIQPPADFPGHVMGIAPNNRAFQYLADCQAAARMLHSGDLVLAGPLNRCCLVPGAPKDTDIASEAEIKRARANTRRLPARRPLRGMADYQHAVHRTWDAIRANKEAKAQARKSKVTS